MPLAGERRPLPPELVELLPEDEPAPLDQRALLYLTERLKEALRYRGRLSLPNCIELAKATVGL
jgi:hypothetical protein